jgi:hypothetical protein
MKVSRKGKPDIQVLSNVEGSVNLRELSCIIGHSGSGKVSSYSSSGTRRSRSSQYLIVLISLTNSILHVVGPPYYVSTKDESSERSGWKARIRRQRHRRA